MVNNSVNNSVNNLLLIAFNTGLAEQAMEALSASCNIDIIDSMNMLEESWIDPGAVIYVMDFSSAVHLYNIQFIRNKFMDKQFFILTQLLFVGVFFFVHLIIA